MIPSNSLPPLHHVRASNSLPPFQSFTTSEQLVANPVDERRGGSAQRQAAARSLAEKVAVGSERERQAQARREVQAADALRAATAVASEAARAAAAVVTRVQVRAPLLPSILPECRCVPPSPAGSLHHLNPYLYYPLPKCRCMPPSPAGSLHHKPLHVPT